VNYGNDARAPLLFIAGGADHLMPPSVNRSNAKHYAKSKAVTDYKEFPGRSHYTCGERGWEQVADYALEWARANATRPGGVGCRGPERLADAAPGAGASEG
jgi:pimeloyl-ACP methyl ester carboxylesterase